MSTQSAHRSGRGSSPAHAHPPRPRYYAGQAIMQHRNSIPESTAPAQHENMNSSESYYSDERSIFDAIRVTTPNEDSHSHDNPFIAGPLMESGLATNMAMFIPPGSSHDGDSTQHYRYGRKRPGLDRIAWRNQLLSDQSAQRTPQLNPNPFNETDTTPSMDQQHRKALSLDIVDSHNAMASHPHPRWPALQTPAAVSPVQPQYPPPERAPTPPGLPSFNSPEAIQYSAQFLVGHTRTPNSPQAATSNSRTASCSGALRRFFGLDPNDPETDNGIVGIGRAPDGTIVQGRFPFRQSGHGTNQTRNLNDHPFHQSTLAPAPAATQASVTETPSGPRNGENQGPVPDRVTEADTTKNQPASQRRKPRHTGLSILGRPLSSLLETRQPSGGESSTAYPRGEISPLQLPEPTYDSAQRPPETERRVVGADVLEAGSWGFWDVVCWIPSHCYACCCLQEFVSDEEDDLAESEETGDSDPSDPLEAITSRETYQTAQSGTRTSGGNGNGDGSPDGNLSPVQEDGGSLA